MQHNPNASDSHELRPLTGIRGGAAIAVVIFHYFGTWEILFPELQVFTNFASQGWLGVDLFFILSGFILSYVYCAGEKDLSFSKYRRFLWFRLARVFPNHLATLGFLLVLIGGAQLFHIKISGDYPIYGLPFQLTLTHAWPWFPGGMWNYPSWTISAEWFAYLCIFPITWKLLKFHFNTITSLVISYALLLIWLLFFSFDSCNQIAPLLKVSCEFIAGSMIFGVFRHGDQISNVCQRYTSAIVILGFGILFVYPTAFPIATVLLFPLFILGLTSETSLISRLFSTTPVLWLGKISYALYMSHAIALKIIKIILPSDHYLSSSILVRLCIFSAHVLIIMIAATSLYYIVEIPTRNFMRRIVVSRSNDKTTCNF